MKAILILLLFLAVQSAMGQDNSPGPAGDPTASDDIFDAASAFGTGGKIAVYGLVFVSLCLVALRIPDAPLLVLVFSIPMAQFFGLRIALAVLQCGIAFVRTRSLRPLAPSWPLAVFLLGVVASSSWALDPDASFFSKSFGVLATLSYVPLVLAVRALVRSRLTTPQRLLNALTLGCIPGCLLITYNALSGNAWRGQAYRMAFFRPDIFSPLLVVAGLYLLFRLTSTHGKRASRLIVALLLPLICVALLLTGIRSGWIGFALGSMVCLLHARRFIALAGTLGVAALVGIVALGAAASLNLDEQMRARLSQGSLRTGETRLELWGVAARGFAERPVTGIGWGCFPALAAGVVGREIVAHNIFVRIWCELGLVGLGVFLAWIAATASKLRSSSEGALVALLMVGVFAQGLFLDLFVCAYFYFFLGLCDGVRPNASARIRWRKEVTFTLAGPRNGRILAPPPGRGLQAASLQALPKLRNNPGA